MACDATTIGNEMDHVTVRRVTQAEAWREGKDVLIATTSTVHEWATHMRSHTENTIRQAKGQVTALDA